MWFVSSVSSLWGLASVCVLLSVSVFWAPNTFFRNNLGPRIMILDSFYHVPVDTGKSAVSRLVILLASDSNCNFSEDWLLSGLPLFLGVNALGS